MLSVCSVHTVTVEPLAVNVDVQPDFVEHLSFLSAEYANLLTVLQMTEISKESLDKLTVFLSRLCKCVSLKSCNSLNCVIDLLDLEKKIFLFNIEPLIACCSIRPNHLYTPFFERKVCNAVLDYKELLKGFLSSFSLKSFHFSLKESLKDITGMAEVTLKLKGTDETDAGTVNCDTAEILEKLPYQLFGVTSKAMLLCEVRTGCVCVTWYVPTSLVPTLREKAECLSSEYLANKGVLELVIGLRIVPNEGKGVE